MRTTVGWGSLQAASLVPGACEYAERPQYILWVDYYDIILGSYNNYAVGAVCPGASLVFVMCLYRGVIAAHARSDTVLFPRAGLSIICTVSLPDHNTHRATPVPHMSCNCGDNSCHDAACSRGSAWGLWFCNGYSGRESLDETLGADGCGSNIYLLALSADCRYVSDTVQIV